jgi:DEAD/DEAH box helicase domain-containing protein
MIKEIAEQIGIRIADTFFLPAKHAVFIQLPRELHADVKYYLQDRYPQGLYSYQPKAIRASLDGNDVCLSTSTASGKSLVFMSVAAHLLKKESCGRVVAFYPVRALIQDQLEKWKRMLDSLKFSVGFVDGSVDRLDRAHILLDNQVVLMTPDVAHAWFMSSLGEESMRLVRRNVRLIVLDEAHVYDGVFGTNMAFFLRRFQAVCSQARMICSTATLGQPNDFIHRLTGRKSIEYGLEQEGASIPPKKIFVARIAGGGGFEVSARLLKTLARQYAGRFLEFADARKMVELVTAAAHRADQSESNLDEDVLEELADETENQLVPYRAGYESDDRQRIQKALVDAKLR